MHDDIPPIEKSGQPCIAPTKMVYPDRRVSQNHHLKRRCGGGLASGWGAPIRARLGAASGHAKGFNASLTPADFSVTPANSSALANNSSSIAIVVLII